MSRVQSTKLVRTWSDHKPTSPAMVALCGELFSSGTENLNLAGIRYWPNGVNS